MAFTVVNGQVYTPGLAIVDAPQPHTPLGGDTLHVAIDVSGNGQLSNSSLDAEFHYINLFLTSTDTSKNFTISNGTSSDSDAFVGPVLDLEPSSTVKHVDWTWPECLVGDGQGGSDSARGDYNISMHQSFRWKGTDYYTVFDLPISVSNSIDKSDDRVDCKWVENELLQAHEVAASNASLPSQPWISGGASSGDDDEDENKDETSRASHFQPGVRQWGLFALVAGGLLWL
ncbi:hypothetical protein P170DRAFT_371757 [Aspergillus steynii IBT 23096]|uniref:Uncharacterized protein n=1 Tax=Aspergillus steynii IBT 23096 TaxID=1392250 RepID=A0A2I2GL99_9EURO|nr:uncharacterized protein P170DRAFT_371757 [Aspergillus steynii IBT 23096]PLB53629.1 hypothetical protein P170DRAFT_371757 [Aspergillus steynii IBT 23096]